MKKVHCLLSGVLIFSVAAPAAAQFDNTETTVTEPALAASPQKIIQNAVAQPVAQASVTLPAETIIKVTPSEEITSKKMKEGTTRRFQMAEDVSQNGVVIIPRGSPVEGEIVWRTGKGIVGKSAKFEVEFRSVTMNGQVFKLHGKHRQEGRGNTAAALLGSMIITGRSATMSPGQIVNAFTAQEITILR